MIFIATPTGKMARGRSKPTQALEPKAKQQAQQREESDQIIEVVGMKPRIKSGKGLTQRKADPLNFLCRWEDKEKGTSGTSWYDMAKPPTEESHPMFVEAYD